jgi:hypothetical protein
MASALKSRANAVVPPAHFSPDQCPEPAVWLVVGAIAGAFAADAHPPTKAVTASVLTAAAPRLIQRLIASLHDIGPVRPHQHRCNDAGLTLSAPTLAVPLMQRRGSISCPIRV